MATELCSLGCGKELLPHDETVWKEVTGYVGGPKKDSMRLRTDTGKHAHNECVIRAQEGQEVGGPTLFDD